MMLNKFVRSFSLVLGFAVCAGVTASPGRLPHSMIPTFYPAQQIQAYPGYQPQYRYRPINRRVVTAPQYRPQPVPYNYYNQRAYYQPAVQPPNPYAYYQPYPMGAYPQQYYSQTAGVYPVPGYMGRYQYPNRTYNWRPPITTYNRHPMTAGIPVQRPYGGIPGYGFRPNMPVNPWVAQGYTPPMPYQSMPVYYGQNRGLAYQFQPIPNVSPYAMAGHPVNYRLPGAIAPRYNPYQYAPGQRLLAHSGLPAPQMSAPQGRYLPRYGVSNQYMAGSPSSVYRFRPDPKFTQPVAHTQQNRYFPDQPVSSSLNQPQYHPNNQGGEKFVWRPMDAIAGNDPY